MKKIVVLCQKTPSQYCLLNHIETSPYGGWVDGFLNEVINVSGFEFYCLFESVMKEPQVIKNIHYISIQNGDWQTAIDQINPDIIHAFGTENNLLLNKVKVDQRVVVWIQGLLGPCTRQYQIDINSFNCYPNQIKNFFYKMVMNHNAHKFRKRAEHEDKILSQINHAIGRSYWDYSIIASQINNIHYYPCNEILREEFYQREDRWCIEKINRHSIFVTQGDYPIKGFHYALEALAILKNQFPNVCLYVAGGNPKNNKSLPAKLGISYSNYLLFLINKYNLNENVIFLSHLDSKEVYNQLKSSHVALIPSLIENSPNSLFEAQIVGTPVVASYVGGVPSFIEHNLTGCLYPCFEVETLAQMIKDLFESDEQCIKMSCSQQSIFKDNDFKAVFKNQLVSAYENIIKSNESRRED